LGDFGIKESRISPAQIHESEASYLIEEAAPKDPERILSPDIC
jgi:hypothetical protein